MTGPLVDFAATARRVRLSSVVLGSLAVGAWLASSLVAGSVRFGALGAWLGGALFGMFLVEVVVVGGSALRGMLHAGDRGERLAGGDVGLLPPQLTGRRPATDDGPDE